MHVAEQYGGRVVSMVPSFNFCTGILSFMFTFSDPSSATEVMTNTTSLLAGHAGLGEDLSSSSWLFSDEQRSEPLTKISSSLLPTSSSLSSKQPSTETTTAALKKKKKSIDKRRPQAVKKSSSRKQAPRKDKIKKSSTSGSSSR
jgi:hypothetical protein